MVQAVEEAAVTCAECGLVGKIRRNPATGRMTVFAPFAQFEALCRKGVLNYVVDCPWWVEAKQAAIRNLKPQSED